MTSPPSPPERSTLAEEFAAAQEWWRDAGVDYDYADDAAQWLSGPAASDTGPARQSPQKQRQEQPQTPGNEEAKPVTPTMLGGEKQNWPTDLAAFQNWWLAEPGLDGGGSFPRVAARGSTGAALMVIVAEPEQTDTNILLSGPQGQLLGNILAAMGIPREETYLAAALPRHTPMPDWVNLQAAGLDILLHHHIALAAPQKICVLGRNIWPLLGHNLAHAAANLPDFNHDSRSVPVMGAEGLAELLRSAPRRARFWKRWLEWTDG